MALIVKEGRIRLEADKENCLRQVSRMLLVVFRLQSTLDFFRAGLRTGINVTEKGKREV